MSQPELTNEGKINEFMNGLCEYIKINGAQDIRSGNLKTPNMQEKKKKRAEATQLRETNRAAKKERAAKERK